jgi:hypothetical protein
MQHEGNSINSGARLNCSPMLCETCGCMMCEGHPSRQSLRMVWPPDALTRLLMKADGVAESTLDALLQRVARTREIC